MPLPIDLPKIYEQIANDSFPDDFLQLDGLELVDQDIQKLAQALEGNTRIRKISLRGNCIKAAGAAALSEIYTIESLDIAYNEIGDNGFNKLLNSYLTTLNVSANGITDRGLVSIENNEFLFELNLSGNELTVNGAKQIAANQSIVVLDLSRNNLGNDGAIFLSKNSGFKELVLRHSHIGNIGAIALGEDSQLEVLILSNNQIGKEGIAGLSKNVSLVKLNLSNNGLQDLDIIPLGQLKSLGALDLTNNRITAIGALNLISRLPNVDLRLLGNNIIVGGHAAFFPLHENDQKESGFLQQDISSFVFSPSVSKEE